jgi:hypothetical protein
MSVDSGGEMVTPFGGLVIGRIIATIPRLERTWR